MNIQASTKGEHTNTILALRGGLQIVVESHVTRQVQGVMSLDKMNP
jgi:hypothetical protein